MIHVLISGALGSMGRQVAQAIEADPDFTVIAGGKEQNGDCGMATELTGMGVVVSALLGLLETCLIFLGLRLSFSFIPVFSVAVLWASLSILTGAFLELLLSIFGQSVYTDIRLQAEPYDRSGRRR